VLLARRIVDPPLDQARPRFDVVGAVLSAAGLFFVVFGVLQTGAYGWLRATRDVTVGGTVVIPAGGVAPVWPLVGIGVIVLAAFVVHVRNRERRGDAPLVSVRLFGNRTSNLGLLTQLVQWLVLQGAFFVISVYLQQDRGYSAIQTGVILLPATIGLLISAGAAQRMAGRHTQRRLVRAGFGATVLGLGLLLALAPLVPRIWAIAPGLFVIGIGIGIMLTASVNLVQSAWPEEVQGDISGVSRSLSNLGSSLGVAVAGSLIAGATTGYARPYAIGIDVLTGFALLGYVAAILIPRPANRAAPPA
jgi:hypothetical protein